MEVKIEIDDELGQMIQKLAAARGVTVSALIEQTLREVYLPEAKSRQVSPRKGKLPSHGHGGLRPGINLDNMAATLDILDEYDAAQ